MLQEMLANDKDATWQSTEAHDSAFKPQATHSNGFSADSSPSRNSNSFPRYHFYGLASTQTQSQNEAIHEGSQKENIGAAERNKDLGQSNPLPSLRPASPHAPPPNAPSKTFHVDSRNGSLSTNKVCLSSGHQTFVTKIFRKLLRKIPLLFLFNPLPVVRFIRRPLNLRVGTLLSLVLYLVLLRMIHSRVIPLKILRNSFSLSRNSLPSLYLNWGVVLSQKAPIPVALPNVQRLPTHQATSSARLVHKAEY
jgi:hypothetical protein